jgi:lipoprotein LpqH
MVKRQVAVGVAGAALVAAGLAGCSSDSNEESNKTKVSVGGQEQDVKENVTCSSKEGSTVITIGDPGREVIATLSDADSPEVLSVVFGDVNGKKYMYTKDMPPSGTEGDAKATKDGNHYKVSGKAGELTQAEQPPTESFEIEATCE